MPLCLAWNLYDTVLFRMALQTASQVLLPGHTSEVEPSMLQHAAVNTPSRVLQPVLSIGCL